MNYESIILELMGRVQKLEAEVKELKESKNIDFDMENNGGTTKSISYTEQARQYILEQKRIAKENGKSEVVIKAADIQTALNIKNRPVIVCNAMYQLMGDKDEVLSSPPSGFSTTVLVKYYL